MNKNRLYLASISALALSNLTVFAQDRPNVVFIYADDLGYGDLQCYGAKNVKTPNVNQLAEDGCRFTNAYAVAATSTPSRYSLLTGEYSWRRPGTDIAPGDAAMIIQPEQITVADIFKSQGYATGAFGKWHLGLGAETGKQDWNAVLPVGLGDLGFNESYIMAATADRVPCVFIENGSVANWDSTAPIEVSYDHPFPGVPTGKDHPELCYNLKSAFGHNMAIVNGIGRIGYMKGGGKALWKDENIADSITSHALSFIRKHQHEPFFMYLATNDVHVPRFPNQRFRGKSGMGLRGDAIVQFDWTVGQVIKALKELNLYDNTIIILTSDNGPVVNDGYLDQAAEMLHGHSPAGPLRGNKYSAFEGGTRVPFIIRWKDHVKAGSQSQAIISQIDMLASMAQLTGARIPRGAAQDSKPQWQVWTGQQQQGRNWVIEQALDHTLSIRTKDWKYISPSNTPIKVMQNENVETGYLPTPQLYQVSRDIHEEHNVASKHPSVVSEMQTLLQDIKQGKE